MEDHINLEEQSNASSGSTCHINTSKEQGKPGDWAKANLMVLIAIVFYPRYKLKFVRFSFRKFCPNDFNKADKVYDHLCNVLKMTIVSSSPIHVDHSKMSLNNDTLKELHSQWHEGGEDYMENQIKSHIGNLENKLQHQKYNPEDLVEVISPCHISKIIFAPILERVGEEVKDEEDGENSSAGLRDGLDELKEEVRTLRNMVVGLTQFLQFVVKVVASHISCNSN
ncbi:hypothetical protein Cgig2_003847 [Carnegiea gigantea]|uniref:Uncharacterized protein n=1 Tax=Carnegiea gigantea TaxID=171969 RepID=A0A9Q1GVJ9_9CARY|nr:hypothetical protein Cgig2_003847 [Carnegiea gigantea]